ncbi:MAG: alpha/beta fold hydrolase [Steroidobacter sp.]
MKLLLYASLCLAVSIPAVAQTSEGDIEVGDGVRIHYVEGGDRYARTTILFIPGWSTSSAIWQDQMIRFGSIARVVSIDPRSQGRSTITTQSNTPEQRARDMHRIIGSLALSNIVLVGWSQGVQDVAAYAAAFEGDAIRGYVLVDAPVGAGAAASVARPEALKQQLERLVVYQQHPREYLYGMMNAIIRSPEGRKRIDEYVTIALRTPPDLGVSMLLMDFIAYDRRPALSKFNRPTLIIAAADSGEIEAQREMSRQIRDARFETIDGAGHAVFIDQPQRFHSLLADFVQRN